MGVRPTFAPLPDAVVDTLATDPDVLIRRLAGLVTSEGLRIRLLSPEEGYLETEWYDIVERRPGGRALDPRRVVRLRFFADPVRPGLTRLVAEAVHRLSLDPSLPEREAERMVPPGHAGDALLRRLLAAVDAKPVGSDR